jgi:hypothetical protein
VQLAVLPKDLWLRWYSCRALCKDAPGPASLEPS